VARATRKQSTPRSADFWRKHIGDWQASGLTQAEFCRQHKLSAGAFWHWKRRFLDQAEEAAPDNKPDIVPIPGVLVLMLSGLGVQGFMRKARS
jgi:hypothetical protein